MYMYINICIYKLNIYIYMYMFKNMCIYIYM